MGLRDSAAAACDRSSGLFILVNVQVSRVWMQRRATGECFKNVPAVTDRAFSSWRASASRESERNRLRRMPAVGRVDGAHRSLNPLERDSLRHAVEVLAAVDVSDAFCRAGLNHQHVLEQARQRAQQRGCLRLSLRSGAIGFSCAEELGVVVGALEAGEQSERIGAGGGVLRQVESQRTAGGAFAQPADELAVGARPLRPAGREQIGDLLGRQSARAARMRSESGWSAAVRRDSLSAGSGERTRGGSSSSFSREFAASFMKVEAVMMKTFAGASVGRYCAR